MKTDASRSRPAPTLEMVAALAGVSRSTVSRVVNDAPNVDPDIVKSVQSAISTLNYIPNRAARSLASRRTNSVAVVVPESTSKVFADPFFATLVESIAQTLVETKYTLNLIVSSEARPEKTRSYLLGGNVDGALVVSHHSGDHSWTRISDSLPVVRNARPDSHSPPHRRNGTPDGRDPPRTDRGGAGGPREPAAHLAGGQGLRLTFQGNPCANTSCPFRPALSPELTR